MRTAIGLVCMCALSLSACGKDRTVEDWRREKVSENLARIQAVSGTYRGVLASDSLSQAMELSLLPDSRMNPGRDANVTEPQASLQGGLKLVFEGRARLLSFKDGFYDHLSGDFKAETTVSLRGGGTATVEISGTVRGETATGRLEVSNYESYGASFEVRRNGPMPEPGRLGNGKDPAGETVFRSYQGTAEFTSGAPAPMDFTLMVPAGTSDQEFADTLLPVKWVDITLVLNRRSAMLFRNAQWDQRTGVLYGQMDGESGNQRERYSVAIRCQKSESGGGKIGWDCSYWSNQQGLLFKAVFLPKGT